MLDPNISEQEKHCVRALAKLLDEGEAYPAGARVLLEERGLAVDVRTYVALMRMMEQYKVIENVTHVGGPEGEYAMFEITTVAVQLVREMERLENQALTPRDIVGQVQEQTRKHPFWAWVIIAFVVLTAAVTLANQTIELLRNVGVLAEKK